MLSINLEMFLYVAHYDVAEGGVTAPVVSVIDDQVYYNPVQ